MTRLFEQSRGDIMVLARYMQILPPELCEKYPGRIINIHHSFLPSFVGAKPYHQAYRRGVKLIGATCHFVTAELDAGPIIGDRAHRPWRHGTPARRKRIEGGAGARLRYHVEGRSAQRQPHGGEFPLKCRRGMRPQA
jgi:formyltetrahydrofolate deformylase